MDYFSEIPEGQAITFSNGVYRQVKIAERAGKVYAAYGGGICTICSTCLQVPSTA